MRRFRIGLIPDQTHADLVLANGAKLFDIPVLNLYPVFDLEVTSGVHSVALLHDRCEESLHSLKIAISEESRKAFSLR